MFLPDTFVSEFHLQDEIKKMDYIPLGNTGIKLSKLSLGGAIFGGTNIYGEYNEYEAISLLKYMLQCGINYIDTAPHYEGSETFLGKALKEIPRKAYYISTKVGRYRDDFDYSESAIFESLNRSLKRLHIDYVDLLIIHDIEYGENLDIIIEETIPAVMKLIGEGKVKCFGLSSYPISPLMEVINRSAIKPDFILSYGRNTLIDNTLEDYMPQLQEKNIGIINAACLSMGLLSNGGSQSWHPAPDEIRSICQNAANYCQERGVELGRLALYHSLNQPGPTTHLVGMGSFSCFKSNWDVLCGGLNNSEMDVLSYLREKFFPPGKIYQWEGVDVEAHRKRKGR